MNQPSVEPPSAEAFEAPEPEAKLEVQDLQKPDIDEPCGGTVAGSEMAEVLRLARMFAGYPDEERVVHFRDVELLNSKKSGSCSNGSGVSLKPTIQAVTSPFYPRVVIADFPCRGAISQVSFSILTQGSMLMR